MKQNQIDEVLGIPVLYRPESKHIAHAVGIWRKRIVVNVLWSTLPYDERRALLYHEAKHCLDNHMLARVKWIPFYWTAGARRLAHDQEIAADHFAFQMGYGLGMLRYLHRFRNDSGSDFYPAPLVRCERLRQSLRGHFHVAA
jgi:hypothetical protein